MTIQQLRKADQKKPFEQFTLKLADGTEVPVRHSENLSYSESGRTVLVVTGDDDYEVVDLLLVTAIRVARDKRGERKKGGNGRGS